MKSILLCAEPHELERTAALARDLGYGLQTQAFYAPDVLDNPAAEIERHKRLLQQVSGPLAIHGPFFQLFPGSRDSLVRETARTRILQGVAIATELTIPNIVFHHNYVPGWFSPQTWRERSLPFWREILEHLPPQTTIHLENVTENEPEILLSLIDEIDDPRCGICLDIGHAHLRFPIPVVEWVDALRDRISFVHIHDNDRSDDQHLSLGKGTLPVQAVLEALQEQAPEAIWVIEEGQALDSLQWLREHNFLHS